MAFLEIAPKLGRMQKEVFNLLKEGEFTNSEIAARLGWTINRTTPRTNELVKKEYAEEASRRKCSITGRKCIAWKIKTNGTFNY